MKPKSGFPATTESDFYSKPRAVEEVADYFSSTPRFIRDEIAAGRLTAHRLSRRLIRIMPADIKRWLSASLTTK